jgi:Glycosyl hydrolase family 115/Gylcosyl hydrolase family 115 C-terminal domain
MTRTFLSSSIASSCPRRSRFLASALNKTILLVVIVLFSSPVHALTIGEERYVDGSYHTGDFRLVDRGTAAPIYVDSKDYVGVVRAVGDLQKDIERVTNCTATINHEGKSLGSSAIIIGTIGKSEIIDRLMREHKIDVTAIAGKWESFLIQVVSKPLPGVASALVIAGSDKRGTIFGIYDLSDQIGVSPWYWWADVPVPHKDSLFVKPGRHLQGPPAVKYRGIFLNDEAPSLTGWVNAKFGTYNHEFYTKVFELLLRLKGNYLWPAMWNNAFNEDDAQNPVLADEYGIVMGTSHHEPMLRAQQEWKRHGQGPWDYSRNADVLSSFWDQGIQRNKNYESITTLGMRGDGDMPMTEGANIALLEKIVADQRKLIAERINPDLAKVPQDWALYKEVQEYYEKGMRVPDDVTLLWCDDNWGNIRRLPTAEERKRSGGAGIYYHFDYVGDPRSYKWLNTNPIAKVWEQMNLAYHYGADRIWIVNVGDLKPMEFPIDFFLNMAWSPEKWPKEKLSEFTRLWAERQFGPEYASAIAEILAKYTKYNGRRKPELLDPGTYSFVDYGEAEKAFTDFQELTAKAEEIYGKLPENQRDAFFELVLYPTKASAIVAELYITAGKNQLYANQGRASANDFATQARTLFQQDAELTAYYNHTLAHGKWDHMMDQTHIGYTFWNQPPANAMPAVSEIQIAPTAQMGVAIEGSAWAWPSAPIEPVLPGFDIFNQQRRYIDVFNRGLGPFEFSLNASTPWIVLSESKGTTDKDRRIWVTVDWSKVPESSTSGQVKVSGTGAQDVIVKVNASRPIEPTRDSLDGFVEGDRYVSMEATHFTRKTDAASARWEEISDLGRTLSSVSVFPVTAESVTPPQNSPHLEYKMYLFDSGPVEVEAILAPTLNFVPSRGLRYALSFDDQPPQIIDALANHSQRDWEETVKDGVRKVKSKLTVGQSGYHTLKFWMVDPGVVLQKLVVNLGGVKPSYLGPPESFRHDASVTIPH